MIRCEGLRWGAPGQPLTPPLDIELLNASMTAVIGANGSGKSSLLKVIAGLQKPLSGKVVTKAPRKVGLSFLPQQQYLDRQFPISLEELVAAGFWGSKQAPALRKQRLESAIADWCLTGLEQRPLIALSGGELQRALLARLSLTEAPVLLLDEPHAALDETGQVLLWKHLHAWHAAGRT
jgi:zinc/manganese transport system ATP-binding protein